MNIFSHVRRLRPYLLRLRAGGPRVASTVTLLGVTLCGVLSFAFTPRSGPVAIASANRLAEASPARVPVRMVGGSPRSKICGEQTWPYIDHNCLNGADKARMTAPQVSAVQPSAGPMSPAQAIPGNLPASFDDATAPVQFANAQDVPLPQPRPRIVESDDPELAATALPDQRRIYSREPRQRREGRGRFRIYGFGFAF